MYRYVTEEQRSRQGCIGRESDRLSHSRAALCVVRFERRRPVLKEIEDYDPNSQQDRKTSTSNRSFGGVARHFQALRRQAVAAAYAAVQKLTEALAAKRTAESTDAHS
jgi:hypothetical protein